jgi:hypothetical protein
MAVRLRTQIAKSNVDNRDDCFRARAVPSPTIGLATLDHGDRRRRGYPFAYVSDHAEEIDGTIASVSRGVDPGLSLRRRATSRRTSHVANAITR